MPCIIVLLVLAFPRVVLAALFLFSNYLERAYHGIIIPIVGFIFLPVTTLAYAWMVNTHTPIDGPYLVALIIAVVIDLGGIGGGGYYRSRR